MPCPQCGAPDPSLSIGDQAACVGGPRDGAACTVHAVSPTFGGLSYGCSPTPTHNVSGIGVKVVVAAATTDTTTMTAGLPCGPPLDTLHPEGGGSLVCLDDFSACNSNADCSVGVSCGVYCHCGFCDDGNGLDPDRPCFADEQCEGGVWTADSLVRGHNQEKPNACDSLICGEVEPEKCCTSEDGAACPSPTPKDGYCDLEPRECANDSQCIQAGAGTVCLLKPRSCFENTITRSGATSPRGAYCIDDEPAHACSTDTDCATGACISDIGLSTTAAISCLSGTASTSVNIGFGWPGPAAMTLAWAVLTCPCGDGEVGCNEECDDGNSTGGDGCDDTCRLEPGGQ